MRLPQTSHLLTSFVHDAEGRSHDVSHANGHWLEINRKTHLPNLQRAPEGWRTREAEGLLVFTRALHSLRTLRGSGPRPAIRRSVPKQDTLAVPFPYRIPTLPPPYPHRR